LRGVRSTPKQSRAARMVARDCFVAFGSSQ
jgi:hypothetical protein